MVIGSICMICMSCGDDFLTKDPPGVVFERNMANREGLESLLVGAYAELDGWAGVGYIISESAVSNWIYGDVYADNAYKGSDPIDQPPITFLEQYNPDPANYLFQWKWVAVYDGISRCNDIIRTTTLALELQTIEQNEAIQFYAEAKFLRGYYHLEAIKMWDFIPYIDETITLENQYVENHPADNVESNAGETPWGLLGGNGYIPWEKVEEDFQYAIENLPDEPRNGYKGRAYKYPAICFMGKVKWFQGDYVVALELFNQVINSGKFSLPENFHDNFRAEGDNNSESIFQYQASVNDDFGGWNGNVGDAINYPTPPGYGFFQPSQNLVNAYKTTDGIVGGVFAGLPYLSTFGLDFNASGENVKNDADPPLNSDDSFTPDTRPLDPRLDWTVGRRGIPYLDWGLHPGKDWIRNKDYYCGPYSPIKNLHYQSSADLYYENLGWGAHVNANNYSIIRFADVLLMAADCEVDAGNLNRARALVNEVRGRLADHPEYWVKDEQGNHAANYSIARYPTGGLSDPFQTKEGASEAVQFERRLELAMEGHRFWDLKKWGIARITLNAYVEREKDKIIYLDNVQFKDKNIRFPIFFEMIDDSKGTLKQNPGY